MNDKNEEEQIMNENKNNEKWRGNNKKIGKNKVMSEKM